MKRVCRFHQCTIRWATVCSAKLSDYSPVDSMQTFFTHVHMHPDVVLFADIRDGNERVKGSVHRCAGSGAHKERHKALCKHKQHNHDTYSSCLSFAVILHSLHVIALTDAAIMALVCCQIHITFPYYSHGFGRVDTI